MPRQSWDAGDVFLIRNADDRFTPGQILMNAGDARGSASCAFFDQRVETTEEGAPLALDWGSCFSTLLSTPDGLDQGIWPVVGRQAVVVPKKHWPFAKLLKKKKSGATVIGSGIVKEFLDAYHGLRPWDGWYEPDYLDKLLLTPDKKPEGLIYSDGS